MITVIAIILFTIAGYFEALMDLLQFRWDRVKKYFADEQFYNPKISWRNKWKNGDPLQGEKFLFSSSIFVGFTDGWHSFKLYRNWILFGGVLLAVLSGNIWVALFAYIFNRIGFSITYNTLYK